MKGRNMRLATLLAVAVAARLSAEEAITPSTAGSAAEKARALLDKALSDGKYPGLQYLVVRADRDLFEYSGGFADIAQRRLMTSDTTMMAYSLTKTFTAVGVLQLVERGLVGLDDDIAAYVPDLPYGPGITIRRLLAQTSGLPDPIPLKWVHAADKAAGFDSTTALRRTVMANPRLAFVTGKRYGYSNISYWILGELISRIGGEGYKRYMTDNVLRPLGLGSEEAGFAIPAPERQAKGYLARFSLLNLVRPFLIDSSLVGGNEGSWVRIRDNYVDGPSFGGLVITARGVGAFLRDQLGESSLILGKVGRELLYQRQSTSNGRPIAMTLGWHIGTLEGTDFFYKEGGGGGFHCEMRLYPARGIGTIMMVNEASSSCVTCQELVDKLFLKH
jgi:D-alanyl-D-alanine carboxypeptidase